MKQKFVRAPECKLLTFTYRVHITFWSSYIKTVPVFILTNSMVRWVCKVKNKEQKIVLKLQSVSVQLNEFGSVFPLRKVYPASRHFKVWTLLAIKKNKSSKCWIYSSTTCFTAYKNRCKPFRFYCTETRNNYSDCTFNLSCIYIYILFIKILKLLW